MNEQKAIRLLESAPGWFQRDAARFGAGVNLADKGYRKLMGDKFFAFFRAPENYEGEVGEWKWFVRRADSLINLTARKKSR